jgi:hypothetical protein
VDIDRGLMSGGIDFDFDKQHPDPWRLKLFAEKQLNAGNIPWEDYRSLNRQRGSLHICRDARACSIDAQRYAYLTRQIWFFCWLATPFSRRRQRSNSRAERTK